MSLAGDMAWDSTYSWISLYKTVDAVELAPTDVWLVSATICGSCVVSGWNRV